MADDFVSYLDVEAISLDETAAGSPERARLEVLCARAQAEIRAHVVGVDARMVAGSLDVDRVRGVAVDMVIAALEHLELGFRTTAEEFPEHVARFSPASAAALVRITDEQVRALAPALAGEAGAYVVSLSG